jgi:N-acetylmuramoyl-L-alanine amidase
MFTPDHIVVHHSATSDGEVFNKSALKAIHLKRGWSDIGYHAVVEEVAGEYEVILGRPMQIKGAHAYGFNHRSWGICFVGNYSLEKPSRDMLEVGIERWILPTMLANNIHPDRVLRHSDTKPTECPGKLFPWDWFKKEVEKQWEASQR